MAKEVYYGDYLQLDKILGAQEPESDKAGVDAHDEMLFIIIHQTYELWFKQILHELKSAKKVFSKNNINDNSPDLHTVVHRMNRICRILEVAVHQVTILETMTPLDFLDFRNLLRPASGFQSIQFKMVEAMLGLRLENRHGKGYYLSQLRPEHIKLVQEIENQKSLIDEVKNWLERMPFLEDMNLWGTYNGTHGSFWDDYREAYRKSLVAGEQENMERFENVFFSEAFAADRRFSPKANRAALFIMLYRDYPLLQLPFRLLNHLLDIDELMAQWRYRHMNMVNRMIGTRIGTGGSSGKDYLKAALDKHYIFQELAELTSFLIERHNVPALPAELVKHIGFAH